MRGREDRIRLMEACVRHVRSAAGRFGSDGQAAGLLTLALLSIAAALLPWMLQGEQKVTLVERGQRFARGLAYSTQGHQLLNVRASRMSAFPDDGAHLARWLESNGLGGTDDFVPRKIHGQYLSSLLS